MHNNISGKIIVITGASSGLGEATARLLASQGARIVLAARRAERINALAEELVESGAQAIAVTTDVARRDDVSNLVDIAVKTFGQIDAMINNAGVMPLSLVEKRQVEEWEQMVDINIKGVLYGVAAALPHMQARKSGHFINVASTAGHRVMPTSSVYSATKYAVRAFSEGLRQEVTPHNIRVTIISPGASATELMSHVSDEELANNLKASTEYALPASAFANMVSFAISQPEEVDVNEILFRPTRQEK
ncbi:NADP-dependent 3-hydroxy acid dehydrogenase YdfG [Erwinia toletana]|uniref:NADP-dependent 3-hydroxy acid dehydrogenase YdfG n=1 Tax=Winslowiella toletana TaxID=92490 RepID=A0ABS4PDP8_9GAMM|nr:SDR family oxidoreductase [Winslowiella toletana]MBP2170759.1 NADP-dependent 3-hydroxy acid dehydrogenase YdfG [Winslowiella toletana]